MVKTNRFIAAGCLLCLALSSCSKGARCGDGTREENGVCVVPPPAADAAPSPPAIDASPPPIDADPTPTEESLVRAWEHDLVSFGFDHSYQKVKSSDSNEGLSTHGWKKKASRWYQTPGLAGMFNNLRITRVSIHEGDTDTYPYDGTIAWTFTRGADYVVLEFKGASELHYSARARQWRQR